MALQSSGPIKMSQINAELGRSSTATISLDTAENGGYATINTCGSPYPLGANSASMSEWYGYNHTAPCGATYNSNFALSDGGDPTQQNMLYSNNFPYGIQTSATRPSPTQQFTISFWVKRDNIQAQQGYIFGLYDQPAGINLMLNWYSLFIGDWYGIMSLTFNDGQGGSFYSNFSFNDVFNKDTTGVANDKPWALDNQGIVNGFGYTCITIVVDYISWGTNDFVRWWWNGDLVTVPWDNNINTNASGQSATYGDSIQDPDWSNASLYLGGSVPSELSSGCLLDSFAIYTSTALQPAQVGGLAVGTQINGTETVAPLTEYQSYAQDDLLYYNFEESGQLGLDTGGYYGQHLDDFNQPTQTGDHA